LDFETLLFSAPPSVLAATGLGLGAAGSLESLDAGEIELLDEDRESVL
jgi:hypothetical protein